MTVATPGTSSKEITGTATAQLAAASHFVISEDAAVEMSDFIAAAKSVQPTAKREGFAVVPNVTWGDVGALAEVRCHATFSPMVCFFFLSFLLTLLSPL
jgi:ribosome biogenesis ATPase